MVTRGRKYVEGKGEAVDARLSRQGPDRFQPRLGMTSDFRQQESGTELLARLKGRSSVKHLEPRLFTREGLLNHGNTVEFHGPEGTGKTEMLYHLVASCILPESTGGLQVEVVFIDTECHFDMLRLVTILEHRLAQSTEESVKQCLGRLFLVHCNSSTQLLLLFHSLESMICSHPALCLLIVDSMSAFYWIDRQNGGESISQQEANLSRCVECLEKLLNEYQLVLIATTQALMRGQGPEVSRTDGAAAAWHPAATEFKPYLCRSWQKLVGHRFIFSKNTTVDDRQEFAAVCLQPRSNVVSRCSFIITDGGVHFL